MNNIISKVANNSSSDFGGGLFTHTITNSRSFGNQQQQPHFVPVETPGPTLLLAVRIMDGLFVGNSIAAQDDEFLFSNKVSHVVNCAGLEAANIYADHGIEYLTFPWRDVPTTVLLDSRDRNITRVANFIDQAFEKGECVLVQSFHGNSRSCVLIAAYFIFKYSWSLESTLAFMQVAHPDMRIKNYFLRQLKEFARKNNATKDIFSVDLPSSTEEEIHQLLLKNTYLNSLPLTEPLPPPPKKNMRKKLTISLREEPPGSRHMVSTVDPKTKERVPIKGILRVKLLPQQVQIPIQQNELIQPTLTQNSPTIPSNNQTTSNNNPSTAGASSNTTSPTNPSQDVIPQQVVPQPVTETVKEIPSIKPKEIPRIMDTKPRSLTLIDPETNSLDDSCDNDGLQILTGPEAKNNLPPALFTPVLKQPLPAMDPKPIVKDNISDTISERSSLSSIDVEDDSKKKKKRKPLTTPVSSMQQSSNMSSNLNSNNSLNNSGRRRPSSFSSNSSTPKTPVSHAPMKFRKPTPPKRSEPENTVEASNSTVTTYSNLNHRLSKQVDSENTTNYSYTGSLATDTPLFVKTSTTNTRERRSISPSVTRTSLTRPMSSTLHQPTISSTLKNDISGNNGKKRPSSAPKSRPKDEEENSGVYVNAAERTTLRSSFGGTASSSLNKQQSTNDLSSSLNSKRTATKSGGSSSGNSPSNSGSRLMRPTLSFLSKTVKKT